MIVRAMYGAYIGRWTTERAYWPYAVPRAARKRPQNPSFPNKEER